MNGASTSFKVEHKNGQVSYYGADSHSRQKDSGVHAIRRWALTRVEDPSGNSMIYRYQTYAAGEHHVRHIDYTGNYTTAGNRRVTIDYEARPDRTSAYRAGGLSRQTRRVKHIRT